MIKISNLLTENKTFITSVHKKTKKKSYSDLMLYEKVSLSFQGILS